MQSCVFDFYEGVGALSLSVKVAAMVVNWLWARRQLAEALVEGQMLQSCCYVLRRAEKVSSAAGAAWTDNFGSES